MNQEVGERSETSVEALNDSEVMQSLAMENVGKMSNNADHELKTQAIPEVTTTDSDNQRFCVSEHSDKQPVIMSTSHEASESDKFGSNNSQKMDVSNAVVSKSVTLGTPLADAIESDVARPPLFEDVEEVLNIRRAVQTFYSKYNPEKINTIDNILRQYRGYEIQLVLHLIQKYNAIDKSDLDIFLGSLEEKEIQQLSEYQLQLKKETSDDSANVGSKEDAKDENLETPKKPQSLETLKGAIGTAKQTLLTSNISDISSNIAGRFMNGWNSATSTSSAQQPSIKQNSGIVPSSTSAENLNNANPPTSPIPTSSSVADDLLLMTRISSMQAEINSLEASKSHLSANVRSLKSQVLSLQKENTALSTELTDGAQRQETIQKSLVAALEREKKNKKDYAAMSSQSDLSEKFKLEIQAKLDFEIVLTENKHKQLLSAISLAHRLEAQLRNVMMKTFDSIPDNMVIKCNTIDPQELAEDIEVEDEEDLIKKDGEVNDVNKNPALIRLQQKIKQLKWKLNISETSLKASRLELSFTHQENAVSDLRIVEQQSTIQSLQDRLTGIYTDLETASGSADSLKKQINESNSELLRYKLMLAVAERNLDERSTELSDSKEESFLLRESLTSSFSAKSDLHYLCAQHTRECEAAAVEYVRVLSDRILLEREELLTRYATVRDLQDEVKSSGVTKTQKELQRLREELFKSRRSETQKERENVFLQKQLLMAAEVISSSAGKGKVDT